MKKTNILCFLIFIICVSPLLAAENNCEGFTEKKMNCFQKGTTASADQVNANFAALLKKIEELEKKQQVKVVGGCELLTIEQLNGKVFTTNLGVLPVEIDFTVEQKSFYGSKFQLNRVQSSTEDALSISTGQYSGSGGYKTSSDGLIAVLDGMRGRNEYIVSSFSLNSFTVTATLSSIENDIPSFNDIKVCWTAK